MGSLAAQVLTAPGIVPSPATGTARRAAVPAPARLVNWMWLASPAESHAALVFDGAERDVLAQQFDRVMVADRAPGAVPDGRFDMISLGNVSPMALQSGRAALGALLTACRARLAPGGVLGVAFEAAEWQGRLGRERGGALRRSTVAALLRDAGFGRTQSYYVASSLDVPEHFIPVDRAAHLAFDRQFQPSTRSPALRRLLVWSGAHALLHRAALVVATG